jgi:hypothetical protein
MIKDAIKYIMELSTPEIILGKDGNEYTNKPMIPLREKDIFVDDSNSIKASTLTGVVDYIVNALDKGSLNYEELIVSVVSPTLVTVSTPINKSGERNFLVKANAIVPKLKESSFLNLNNSWLNTEEFIIYLMTNFVPNEDLELLLKFAGNVVQKSVSEYGDDGVSQKATLKTGVASRNDAIIPNPVSLTPYRTFSEIKQPESKFVFRMKNAEQGILCALFSDGDAKWRNEAISSIRKWLQVQFKDRKDVYIIA